MTRVKHPNPLLYLCQLLRTELNALADPRYAGVFVSNRKAPADAGVWERSVILRVDGDVRTSVISKELTLGVRVRAGQDITDEQPAEDLAATALAILEGAAGLQPGNPIAAHLESNGPYSVPGSGAQPEYYFTISFSRAGVPF